MKRFIALTLALLTLLSVPAVAQTSEEILFRELPWGMNSVSYVSAIIRSFDPDPDIEAWLSELGFSSDPYIYYFDADAENFEGVAQFDGEMFISSTQVFIKHDAAVAGYPLESIHTYAIPAVVGGAIRSDTSENQITMASYSLKLDGKYDENEVYADLIEKLSSLYGDPDMTYEGDTDGKTAWLGANHTYAYVSHSSSGISIRYGISNVPELLELIRAAMETAPDTDGL